MIEHPVERTAIHESGQAVVAVHLGVPFESQEILFQLVGGKVAPPLVTIAWYTSVGRRWR